MLVAPTSAGALKTIVVRFTIDAVGASSYVSDDVVPIPNVVVQIFAQLSIPTHVGGEGKPSSRFTDGVVSDFRSAAIGLLDEGRVGIPDEVSVDAEIIESSYFCPLENGY